MANMIELNQVSKRFGEQVVLKELTFSVPRGEIVGILGPNGSGKTTTIRLINGVIRPDSGQITVAGHDPSQKGDTIRLMSGILTESASLYMHMSGLENLLFFAQLYGVTDQQRPIALLDEFGLTAHRDKKAGTYSTGMKRRLGLAKALLHRPEILFLDEPTNGLDPEGARMVLEHIVQLNRRDGTTVLLCSHLLEQMEAVCDRYLFLDEGRLIEQGTLAELEAKHRKEVLLHVETDVPVRGEEANGFPARALGTGRVEFQLPGRDAVPPLLRALLNEGQVFSATIVNQDLASLYFRIREGERHE